MKHADCAEDTVHDQGGSKTLMGMLLNQINGLKLLPLTSRQCSGHHVQLRSHYWEGYMFIQFTSMPVSRSSVQQGLERRLRTSISA